MRERTPSRRSWTVSRAGLSCACQPLKAEPSYSTQSATRCAATASITTPAGSGALPYLLQTLGLGNLLGFAFGDDLVEDLDGTVHVSHGLIGHGEVELGVALVHVAARRVVTGFRPLVLERDVTLVEGEIAEIDTQIVSAVRGRRRNVVAFGRSRIGSESGRRREGHGLETVFHGDRRGICWLGLGVVEAELEGFNVGRQVIVEVQDLIIQSVQTVGDLRDIGDIIS